jgi:hypothetical protein
LARPLAPSPEAQTPTNFSKICPENSLRPKSLTKTALDPTLQPPQNPKVNMNMRAIRLEVASNKGGRMALVMPPPGGRMAPPGWCGGSGGGYGPCREGGTCCGLA